MYSQSNEEEIILKYFAGRKGAFLDIGANDGITLSNTYALAQSGWKGVCVEASPVAFGRLLTAYAGVPHDICCLNYAIGGYDGEILLHESGELLGKGDIALVSSIKVEETKRWTSLNMPFKDVLVPMLSFKTLLIKSKRKTFDFISIDIEGMELEVLPQMDLKALGTKLICVEFNGKEKEKYDEIIIPQGFKLIHKNGENLIYSI